MSVVGRGADLGLLHLEFLLDLMIRAGAEPFLGGLQHGVTRRCRTAVDRVDQHQFFFHPNGAQSPPPQSAPWLLRVCVSRPAGNLHCVARIDATRGRSCRWQRRTSSASGSGGEFIRDARYITTRITRDGRDGYPVEPGRYRLVVARACPWANRATIVRRLLGLEHVLSLGVCGPTHDERSWTFDLDPGRWTRCWASSACSRPSSPGIPTTRWASPFPPSSTSRPGRSSPTTTRR